MPRHVRAVLPWLGLGVTISVASVFEHALASSTLSSVGTESPGIDELPARAVPVPDAGSLHMRGTVILHDAVTGRDMVWPCITTPENPLTDDLVVDGRAWADMAVALCAC